MTALTCYLTDEAATTVTTANLLYTTSGSPSTTGVSTSLIRNNTGWGEEPSQGSGSWAYVGSEPSPSGKGWLLDSTLLEGQQFGTGNWSGTAVFTISSTLANTITVTLHLRAYKRSSSGVYTNIVDSAASSTSISKGSNTTVSFPSHAGTATTFSTGDKLYIDIVGDITQGNTNNGSLEILDLSTDTSGLTGSSNAEIVTPGYSSSGGGATHWRIFDGLGGVFS